MKKHLKAIASLFTLGLLVALIVAIMVLAIRGGFAIGMGTYKLLFGR